MSYKAPGSQPETLNKRRETNKQNPEPKASNKYKATFFSAAVPQLLGQGERAALRGGQEAGARPLGTCSWHLAVLGVLLDYL